MILWFKTLLWSENLPFEDKSRAFDPQSEALDNKKNLWAAKMGSQVLRIGLRVYR